MEVHLHYMIGLSVIIPGDPTVSGFKLLEETFEQLTSHKWTEKSISMKLRVMQSFLGCICTLLQNKLPFHAFKGNKLNIDKLDFCSG